MSAGWSFGTMLATIRVAGTNGRNLTTVLYLGGFVFIVLLAVLALAVRRIYATHPLATPQSSLIIKSKPSTATSHSETAVDINTAPTSSSLAAPTSGPIKANVTVNGQTVPLPSSGNGTIHKVIPTSNGATSVNVSVHSTSNANSATDSSFNLDVQSSSDSTTGQSP